MTDIDHIEIRPDAFGWELLIHFTATDPHNQKKIIPYAFGIGDAIQFHAETERTIGQWLADGPADFHASAPYDQQEDN